jgi:hypothetical protein
MANDNKQGQGTGGRMGKDAGRKPFGGGGGEGSRPGVEREDEGSEPGYDIDLDEPTRKEVSPDAWRDRPMGGSHKPQK